MRQILTSKNVRYIGIAIAIYLLCKLIFHLLWFFKNQDIWTQNLIPNISTIILFIAATTGFILKKNWSKYIILLLLGFSTVKSIIYLTVLTHYILILGELVNILINVFIVVYLFLYSETREENRKKGKHRDAEPV